MVVKEVVEEVQINSKAAKKEETKSSKKEMFAAEILKTESNLKNIKQLEKDILYILQTLANLMLMDQGQLMKAETQKGTGVSNEVIDLQGKSDNLVLVKLLNWIKQELTHPSHKRAVEEVLRKILKLENVKMLERDVPEEFKKQLQLLKYKCNEFLKEKKNFKIRISDSEKTIKQKHVESDLVINRDSMKKSTNFKNPPRSFKETSSNKRLVPKNGINNGLVSDAKLLDEFYSKKLENRIESLETHHNTFKNMVNQNNNLFDVKTIRILKNSGAEAFNENTIDKLDKSIMNQIVKKVHIDKNTTQIRINLKPETLGNVRMNIVSENGIVKASFFVENKLVKDIIENNLDHLKHNLQNQGVAVQEFSVEVDSGQDNWMWELQKSHKYNVRYSKKLTEETLNNISLNVLMEENSSVNLFV